MGARAMNKPHLLILRKLARRPTLVAQQLSTFSRGTSTTTSSTTTSPLPLAFPRHVLSATRQQESTAPRIAKRIVCLAGASLVACPALRLHRRPLPLARDSLLQQQILVKRRWHKAFWRQFECLFHCRV